MITAPLLLALSLQARPEPIPTKELPAKAVCVVCVTLGSMLTEDKVTHGLRYRGKPYYFHGEAMRDMFLKDPEAYADPVLPRPMPKLDLKDLAGKVWNAEAFRGRTVLVDFWATWCGPCRETLPTLHALAKDRPDVTILSVSVDQDRKALDKFLKASPFPNPVLHDRGKTFAKWHVTAIPALFLVKDGQIVAQWRGVVSRETLDKAL